LISDKYGLDSTCWHPKVSLFQFLACFKTEFTHNEGPGSRRAQIYGRAEAKERLSMAHGAIFEIVKISLSQFKSTSYGP